MYIVISKADLGSMILEYLSALELIGFVDDKKLYHEGYFLACPEGYHFD